MIAQEKTQTKKLMHALEKGLIDQARSADEELVPALVFNDPARGRKVFCWLEKELRECTSFFFSVAFITMSGLQLLKPVLRELEARGVKGRILTTDYLAFSEPDALDVLAGFSNLELRMYLCDENDGVSFHTKCYFFSRTGGCTVLVGSSNLTASALSSGCEWNAQVCGLEEGEYISSIRQEFERLYSSINSFPYEAVSHRYRLRYEMARTQRAIAGQDPQSDQQARRLCPNAMQVEFIERLRELEAQGADKALLVSATGTRKTYASAFAMRELGAKRVLFLVHREQIARQARDSFRRVFGSRDSFGLLGGGKREYEARFLFSTVQTLSQPSTLAHFSPDDFDYIIIDEVHRAAAASYQRVFEAFRPKLWLGMSATPTRTDHQSIYELFDYNVACSIGIRDALEEDLLCPFHYYALSDLQVDDETVEDPALFGRLTDPERIRHILDQAAYYGHSGGRLKGLMFVSSVKEAEELSKALNKRGLRTLALSGADSQAAREKAIERLCTEEDDGSALDYLISVDIFNEGVDIPSVNLVVPK